MCSHPEVLQYQQGEVVAEGMAAAKRRDIPAEAEVPGRFRSGRRAALVDVDGDPLETSAQATLREIAVEQI